MDFALDKWIGIVFVIYSVSLHELGHALTATYFGDPTPGRHGRLTWNPLVQLHPVYSIAVPLVSFLLNGTPLGFAYCPIDPSRFRRPLRDRALTALAGPAVNFTVMLVCLGLLWIEALAPHDSWNRPIFFGVALWNMILGVFNLMPIPGLDGYDVIRPALPLGLRRPLDDLRHMGYLPLLVIFLLAPVVFGQVIPPFLALFIKALPSHITYDQLLELFAHWRPRGY